MDQEPDVELWATALSLNTTTGRQIIWRYAKDFRAGLDRTRQPYRILIVWNYASETGQPDPTDHEAMNRLEDALEGVLRGSQVATLALVSTGENLREWTYYAQSEDSFSERFDEALEDLTALPIDIHVAHDPMWSMYTKFRVDNPKT